MFIETMEGRTHFDGTVTEGYPGVYEVSGTSAAETFDIVVDQQQGTFTLDDVTYTGVVYIFVSAGDGDDTVSVVSATRGYVATSVVAGHGNDQVTVNFDGAIWCGPGDDAICLTDSFRGEVFGDSGDDQIYILGDSVDADVDGGDGDDVLDATACNYGVYLRGGNGNDWLFGSEFDDTLHGDAGNDFIFAGGGDDIVYADDGIPDHINGGTGDDWLYGDPTEGTVGDIEYVG